MIVFRKSQKLVLISVMLLAAMTASAQVLQQPVQPVQPVEPIQTIDRGTRDQLLEKTRVGVANVLSASQVSDTTGAKKNGTPYSPSLNRFTNIGISTVSTWHHQPEAR